MRRVLKVLAIFLSILAIVSVSLGSWVIASILWNTVAIVLWIILTMDN